MNGRVFIDANVPMYAAGRAHPCREAAREVMRGVAAGRIDAFTDSKVLQEILCRYFAINEMARGFRAFDAFIAIMEDRVLPVTAKDMTVTRRLAERLGELAPRDLVHLAVMRNHGIPTIVSADAAFDGVEWVTRIGPAT